MAKNGDLKDMPTVKLGTDDEPVLHTFKETAELISFVKGLQQHIQDILIASWKERNEIDWSIFE